MILKKYQFVVILILIGFVCLGSFEAKLTLAAPGDSALTGYAWSPNIGWVSFEHSGSNGVYLLAQSSGYRSLGGSSGGSGYAWNPTIGWIKFDPNFTGPNGQDPHGARLNTSTGNFTGWARACGVFVASSCSGALVDNSERGGWDGWIKFSGSLPDYGVTFTNSHLDGYAWGGNVIGWISFCDPNSGALYCVRVPDISATCQIFYGSNPVSGAVTLNHGEQLRWRGEITGGAAPYNKTWSGHVSGSQSGSNNYFEVFSNHQCLTDPSTAAFNATFEVIDNNNLRDSCLAQTVVTCNPGPPPSNSDYLSEPNPEKIRITNQPISSAAVSSETVFNGDPDGPSPFRVRILSSQSLVDSKISLDTITNEDGIKVASCRMELTRVANSDDSAFTSCDINNYIDFPPADGGDAYFNVRISESVPDLTIFNPYRIVVGSSTCSVNCNNIVRSFLFDYAAGTVTPI